jgi:hypothetical protein
MIIKKKKKKIILKKMGSICFHYQKIYISHHGFYYLSTLDFMV